MKAFNLAALAIMAASVTACSTVMPAPSGGFPSSKAAAVANRPAPGPDNARVRAALNPALVTVGEVVWQAGETADISAQEQRQLQDALRLALQSAIQGMPASPEGHAAVVRAAITQVNTVSPLLNTASALVLFVPLDRGGATVEIEAIDPLTGAQLAAYATDYSPPMTQLKARFSKLAPAEIALKKAAANFAPVLAAAGAP